MLHRASLLKLLLSGSPVESGHRDPDRGYRINFRDHAMQIFYVGLIAFSLMTGKTCLASTKEEPWQREVKQLREAHARQDLKGLATLQRAQSTNYGALANHPLRIFAEYWRLSLTLSTASGPLAAPDEEEIRRFLAKNADTRAAQLLRRDWLVRLGKARIWNTFSEEYVKHGGEEQDIACYSWQERLDRDDAEVLSEARALWLSGRATPESCDATFRALLAARKLDSEAQWLRLRKLLEQGALPEARRMVALQGLDIKIDERKLVQAHNDAGRFLAREKFEPKQRASIELTLHAVQRYARKDAADAANWLDGRAAAFPESARRQAWAQIATQAAMQHEPRAGEWFARAEGLALSDPQSGWRVRAALREQNWKAVEAAINAMPAQEKRESAWRYWLARARTEQGRKAEAAPLLAELAKEFNFYGLLAAEETGQLALPAWQSWTPAAADLDALRQQPALKRSLLLYQAGLPQEGLQEWRWAMRGLDDKQYLTAAALAVEAGVQDRALNAADRTVALHDFTRRFPLHLNDKLLPAAKEQSLDPAWVYGLIKQESAFIEDVRSWAGAIGLMQLMPTTAKWVAGKVKMGNYHTARLADVDTNLALGNFYLRHLLDDLSDPVLATAAYNAGPGRARRWRAESPLEGAIYAETIPFNETRDYVKRVMANAWYYSGRLGTPKTSFKAMVGTVPARGNLKLAVGETAMNAKP